MRATTGARAILLGAMAAGWLSACAAGPARVPGLRVDSIDFRNRISTICLNSLADDDAEEDSKKDQEFVAKLQAIDQMVAAELQRLGYTTVEAEWVRAAWDRAATAEGGCVNIHTGRADVAKCDVIRARWRSDLQNELGCNAVLNPEIALVRAPFRNGMAEWDGVQERLGGDSGSYGFVGALSVSITLNDTNGTEVYFSTGGIQTLSTLNSGFWSSEFENVPPDQLLASPGRNLAGVQAALADLPNRTLPPPPSHPDAVDSLR